MKRVLCIVGGMNAGGAETFLMKVYRQLDKTKYQMDFAVATEQKGYYDDEILELGGKIFHITPKSKGFFRNFNSMRRVVRENKYQYVLRTSQHSLSALELFAARLGGAKTRVFRSSNSNTMTTSKKQLILHKACLFMPRLFANVRIAPSTEAAEFMFGKGSVKKGRAALLHNGVDLSVYRYHKTSRDAIRKEFGIAEDAFAVGHVGRFQEQKNHLFLLEVFHQIHQKNEKAVLLLVGNGELEKQIREKAEALGISDNVIFTGVRSDVPDLLSAMDVFAFPSLYEGMPNTVIEAQATGLSCVISDTITKEANITGLVEYLPLGDASAWAERVMAAAQKPRLDTTEHFVNKRYDIHSVAEHFTKLVFGEP